MPVISTHRLQYYRDDDPRDFDKSELSEANDQGRTWSGANIRLQLCNKWPLEKKQEKLRCQMQRQSANLSKNRNVCMHNDNLSIANNFQLNYQFKSNQS